MNVPSITNKVFEQISEDRLVALTRAIIAIPSPNFEEGAVADFLADYMSGLGLDVSMMDVEHPFESFKKTRQPARPPPGHW